MCSNVFIEGDPWTKMCRHPNSLAPSEFLMVTTMTPLFFLFNLLPCISLHRNSLSYLESPLLLWQLLGSQQIYLTWNKVDNYFSDNLCRRCADGRVREKHMGQWSIWYSSCMSLWFDLELGDHEMLSGTACARLQDWITAAAQNGHKRHPAYGGAFGGKDLLAGGWFWKQQSGTKRELQLCLQ